MDHDQVPAEERSLHQVPVGEVLLGQKNTYGIPADGPVVPESAIAAWTLKPAAAEGFYDLGLNGTYIVFRQLKQEVTKFWENMRDAAKNLVDEKQQEATAEWLATKIVGRTLDGNMLTPQGPDCGNDTTFFANDREGFGCPITSHVRRANPRDGLAPDQKNAQEMINAANRHRIVRRGRIYGVPIADRDVEDNVNRGLLFICMNSDIARQFEFVQHTWLLNRMFGGGYKENDPILGSSCPFTIPFQAHTPAAADRNVHHPGGWRVLLSSKPQRPALSGSPLMSTLSTLPSTGTGMSILRPAATQASSLKGRAVAWGVDHLDGIFRVLRNVWPIPSLGRMALVTRFDDVEEVLSLSEVFVNPYNDKLNVIMGGHPFFLGMTNTEEYTRDTTNMRMVMRRTDIETRLTAATLASAAAVVGAGAGEVDIVELVRNVTFDVLCDYFGTPGPPDADLRVWATRLFEFQFADQANDPALRAEVDVYAPALREHIDSLLASRKPRRRRMMSWADAWNCNVSGHREWTMRRSARISLDLS